MSFQVISVELHKSDSFCKKNEKGEITFVAEIPKPEFIFRIKKIF